MRLARGLTQDELAAASGVSVDTISRLERGTRQTTRRSTLALLSTALMVEPGVLIGLQTSQEVLDADQRRRAVHPLNLPEAAGPTEVPVLAQPQSGSLIPSAPTMPLARNTKVDYLSDDSQLSDPVENSRQKLQYFLLDGGTNSPNLDDWEMTATRYAIAARDREPSLLLNDLVDDISELQSVLIHTRSSSSLRRLTRVAAQLSGLICLTLVKLDDHRAFRRWARTARIAATEVDDPATLSWVLAQEAYGHFYNHDAGEAVAVAQHAQSVSLVSVGGVLAAALEARAHAVRENSDLTHQSLARAADTLAKLSDDEISNASAFSYSEAQFRFHESNALTHLGDTKSAYVAQERALGLVGQHDFMDATLVKLDHAICLTTDNDGTGAAGVALESMLALGVEHRRGIISRRAQEVLTAIPESGRRSSPARDLQDLLMLPTEKEIKSDYGSSNRA